MEAGTSSFDQVFNTLVEGNQSWAGRAGALIAIASRTEYAHNGEVAPTHSFDAGAAWMSIALQANKLGLVAHGMRGFDQASARQVLKMTDVYDLPAIIAVGYPGDPSDLLPMMQEKEAPSDRMPLSDLLFNEDFSEAQ